MMYLFEGSEACVKVICVDAVTSSSCGIVRPLHFVAFAPGGGGGGFAWPSICAVATLIAQNATATGPSNLSNRRNKRVEFLS